MIRGFVTFNTMHEIVAGHGILVGRVERASQGMRIPNGLPVLRTKPGQTRYDIIQLESVPINLHTKFPSNPQADKAPSRPMFAQV